MNLSFLLSSLAGQASKASLSAFVLSCPFQVWDVRQKWGISAPVMDKSLEECAINRRDTGFWETSKWEMVCFGGKYDNMSYCWLGYNASAETQITGLNKIFLSQNNTSSG